MSIIRIEIDGDAVEFAVNNDDGVTHYTLSNTLTEGADYHRDHDRAASARRLERIATAYRHAIDAAITASV
jgi:hypothetical protein